MGLRARGAASQAGRGGKRASGIPPPASRGTGPRALSENSDCRTVGNWMQLLIQNNVCREEANENLNNFIELEFDKRNSNGDDSKNAKKAKERKFRMAIQI